MPWPALAWWAATLPGSAARGGVTVWVRLVAFAVRVVMSRAASVVAVDVDSFRAAAPPGHGAKWDSGDGNGNGSVDEIHVGVEVGDVRRREGGTVRGVPRRRDEELKEDGAALFSSGVAVGAGGGGGGSSNRASSGRVGRTGQAEGGGGTVGERKGAAFGGAAGGGCSRRRGSGCFTKENGGGTGVHMPMEKVVVVLLPTHRSYLDFVLVSLFCASMRSFPGLSWLRVPKVAAADGPFGKEGTPLRWVMEKLGECVPPYLRQHKKRLLIL